MAFDGYLMRVRTMAKPFPRFGPFNIVADTNALRAQDSRKLISSGFDRALSELRKLTAFQLHIPDVVLGELAYQKFEMAMTSIGAITSNSRILTELTGHRESMILSAEKAKRLILKRYTDWCKKIGARRLTPKIRQATWNKMVNDAVWRIEPFERSEDRKHERGFRDRVVLEAVTQLCAIDTTETVLLTEDGLLSKAVRKCGARHLTIVPRLEDFTSRVRLMKDDATNAWIEILFNEATKAFYERDNPNCLYLKESIHRRVIERAEDLLPPRGDPLMSILEPSTWDRQTEDRITLGTTQFEKLEQGRFYWKTDVHAAAAYTGRAFFDSLQEKIRVSTFAIRWSSHNSSEAEIRDAKIEDIALTGRQMLPDSSETRTQWSLPSKPTLIAPTFASLSDLLERPAKTTSR